MGTGIGRLSLEIALGYAVDKNPVSTGGLAHCPEVGGFWGRARFGDLEMHLEWWKNPWVDGCVDGSASQSGSLKSGLPSYTVGVSVGKDHSGRFIGSRTIQQLASPIVGFLCDRL